MWRLVHVHLASQSVSSVFLILTDVVRTYSMETKFTSFDCYMKCSSLLFVGSLLFALRIHVHISYMYTLSVFAICKALFLAMKFIVMVLLMNVFDV